MGHFDLDLRHIPGNMNTTAEALSHQPVGLHSMDDYSENEEECSDTEIPSESQEHSPAIRGIIRPVSEEKEEDTPRRRKVKFEELDNQLFSQMPRDRPRLPKDAQQ